MPTKLNRKVVRETTEIDPRSRRPLIIELVEGGRLVRIKEKGLQSWYTVTFKQIFVQGAYNKAQELKAKKKLEKEQRRVDLRR